MQTVTVEEGAWADGWVRITNNGDKPVHIGNGTIIPPGGQCVVREGTVIKPVGEDFDIHTG